MKKIVVLGAGHGGILAAIKLASKGYDVTVLEQNSRGNVSHDWEDDIRFDIFQFLEIDPPPKEVYSQKLKWRFISPDEKSFLRVPQLPPLEEVSVSRRGLIDYLISLAEKAGVKIQFSTKALSLKFNGNMVVGVLTETGQEYDSDLVIDASGLRSPFRGQLPDSFLVQKQPAEDDLMQACRAFSKPSEGVAKPDPDNSLTILHLDYPGIAWCNHNHLGEVDVLIGRIGKLTQEEARLAIENLRFSNPILSDIELRTPTFAEICVRNPLPVPVADGYAAVGDSAFQTMPLMGSGIEASMKAGKYLYETVVAAGENKLTASVLWPYQVLFMEDIGASYMFIDVLKRWALSLPPKQINWLFASGAISESDLAMISTEKDPDAKPGSTSIARKAMILLKNPRLIGLAAGCLIRASFAKSIASKIPEKYDIQKIAKWKEKYDGCIDHKQ